MIVWTHAALGVLYACVLYFCICTSSAQLSMFHMERRSRNTLLLLILTITLFFITIVIIFIIVIVIGHTDVVRTLKTQVHRNCHEDTHTMYM